MKTMIRVIGVALLTASRSFADADATPRGRPENAWRYELFNGRWWYWTPDDHWAFYNGRRWVTLPDQPARPFVSRGGKAAGGAAGGGAYPNLGNESYSKALSA